MLLADLGADVIKVESIMGDDTRSWRPPHAELKDENVPRPDDPPESAYFLSVNRNKRAISVDFKKSKGLEVIHELVKQSDVLVENYIPGKLDKMGLGYEQCRALNPSLIYTSISGYGQSGPFATAAGYDVVIEAEAGLMHITGEPDGPPCKVGVAVTDVSTGLYAHGAILAALLSRQRTGEGIAGLANIASNYLISGQGATRHGTAHPSIVFPCKDGYLMIGAGNDAQFKIFCDRVLGRSYLAADPRYQTNTMRVKHRKELVEEITTIMKGQNRDYWIQRLTGLGVPFGPINDIEQTFDHPQVRARGLVVEVDHPRVGPIKLVGPAVSYNGSRMKVRMAPPFLGQHTDEVLKELGYKEQDIEAMKRNRVVA
ncbi:CoA-transferase family III [Serendipita vermifera]|nr:CoA-transferase family III [Serendipita vermifera]